MTRITINVGSKVPIKTVKALKTLLGSMISSILSQYQSDDFVDNVKAIVGEDVVGSVDIDGNMTFNVGMDATDFPVSPKKTEKKKTRRTKAVKKGTSSEKKSTGEFPVPIDSSTYSGLKSRDKNAYVAALCKLRGWGNKPESELLEGEELTEDEDSFNEDFKRWMDKGLDNVKGKHVTKLGSLKPAIRDKIANDKLIDEFMAVYAKYVSPSGESSTSSTKKGGKKKFSNLDYEDRDKVIESLPDEDSSESSPASSKSIKHHVQTSFEEFEAKFAEDSDIISMEDESDSEEN